MRQKSNFLLILFVAMPLIHLSAFGGAVYAQAPPGTPESGPATSEGADTSDSVVVTRTPEPTATPGVVTEGVSTFARETGLTRVSILGLSAEDWINLGISLLIALIGYLAGTWVIKRFLPQVVRRTPTDFDNRLLEVTGPSIRWLVVLFIFQFAIARLTFVRAELKAFLQDILFVLAMIILFHIFWQLISVSDKWFTKKAIREERGQDLAPVIKLLVILGRVFAAVIATAILLSHFGVNVTVLVATLGIGGLALSLAARDIIADILAGITILTNRPFRIGDRIEIQAIDTWGDVVDIGLRTTQVRITDNRMVIIPNSNVVENEVVNYTYPDPRYRIQTHVRVAYGTDVETVRRVIIDTVRRIEGVLPDEPVDALYNEMAETAMIFRIRWWVESYIDTRQVIDQVHTSVQAAFDADRIEIPFPTGNLNLQLEPETVDQISRAFKNSGQNVSAVK